jgi:rhomboid protease GluP
VTTASTMRVTYILIIAEIAAYSVLYSYSDTAFSYLGFSASGFLGGEFWTPVSSIFIHVDLFHLATNMLFLCIFGIALEDKMGPEKAIVIFFGAGVTSLLAGTPFYSPYTHTSSARRLPSPA